MKSSHCRKYKRNFLKHSALSIQGRMFQIFLFIFWPMGRLHIFILKFPDLQWSAQLDQKQYNIQLRDFLINSIFQVFDRNMRIHLYSTKSECIQLFRAMMSLYDSLNSSSALGLSARLGWVHITQGSFTNYVDKKGG